MDGARPPLTALGGAVSQFRLHASRRLTFAIVAVHALTLLPLWLCGLDPGIAAVSTLLIVAHGAWCAWRVGALRASRSILSLTLGTSSSAVFAFRDGSTVAGTIEPSTVVTGHVVTITVRAWQSTTAGDPTVRQHSRWSATTHRVVIVTGMLDPDSFRRLRVLLRWGSPGATQPEPALQTSQQMLV